jgi:hypothetical protein
LQSPPTAVIQLVADGPCDAKRPETFSDWLGVPAQTPPLVVLCRCGESPAKPFCDGTHAQVGFTDNKEDNRVLDRRDAYPGV